MTPMLAAAVLVELFTSEGCSSCPPADAVLARLHEEQPVPGVDLIVLSEHVDYWNDLGWKDPFSDRLFSDRQGDYGSRIYTPQAIVDGRTDVLGSDRGGIIRAAASAARDPHGTVRLARTSAGVRIAVDGLPGHRDAAVMLAVLEDGLQSKVERGENAGRTLSHTAVARSLKEVGRVAAGDAQWSAEVTVALDVSWKKARLIAFVQDGRSRRVLAAGALQQRGDGAAADGDQRGGNDQAHGAEHAHTP
jgi:hypothetical protein